MYSLPNPIDDTLLEAKPTEYKANGPPLFVGRLEWYKGVHIAVLTAMCLRRRIIVAGSGSLYNYVKGLSSCTPLIEFRGLVGGNKLHALYREASIVLVSSIL